MMVPHCRMHCRMLRWQPPRWRKLPRGCGRAWHSTEGIRSRTTPSETRLLPALSQHRSQQRPWPATMRPLGRGIQRRCDSIPEIQTPLLALQRYRQCPFCLVNVIGLKRWTYIDNSGLHLCTKSKFPFWYVPKLSCLGAVTARAFFAITVFWQFDTTHVSSNA